MVFRVRVTLTDNLIDLAAKKWSKSINDEIMHPKPTRHNFSFKKIPLFNSDIMISELSRPDNVCVILSQMARQMSEFLFNLTTSSPTIQTPAFKNDNNIFVQIDNLILRSIWSDPHSSKFCFFFPPHWQAHNKTWQAHNAMTIVINGRINGANFEIKFDYINSSALAKCHFLAPTWIIGHLISMQIADERFASLVTQSIKSNIEIVFSHFAHNSSIHHESCKKKKKEEKNQSKLH